MPTNKFYAANIRQSYPQWIIRMEDSGSKISRRKEKEWERDGKRDRERNKDIKR